MKPFFSRKAPVQPALDVEFEQRPFHQRCRDPLPGESYCYLGPRLPFRHYAAQTLTLPLSEVPALTLTGDEHSMIHVEGTERDHWLLNFCSEGQGDTESEALAQLEQVSMNRIGHTVSVRGFSSHLSKSSLKVNAPAAAPIVVYASFTAVQVYNMAAPVRVVATHARARILDTTGKVDAAGFVVDFAGSEGTVKLSSESQINLILRTTHFRGSLMAWAQGDVKILLPASFQTPFVAIVNRRQDFVCRANIKPRMTLQKQGSLCIFTYPGDGSTPPNAMHFRSERQAIVIDSGA